MVPPQEALKVILEVVRILEKILWYQKGHLVSSQQWNDILGVLKVQGARLDFNYLKEWAGRIGVEDLLRQACEDAGVSPRTD